MNLLIKLGDILEHNPCGQNKQNGRPAKGWRKLLAGLGMTAEKYDSEYEISLGDVLVINGLNDALWCFRVLDWSDVKVRRKVIAATILPAVERASLFATDARVLDCVSALRLWCEGDDTVDLLAAAWTAETAWVTKAAVWAARTARTAARAAEAAGAARAAWTAEREKQRQDILSAFPPVQPPPVKPLIPTVADDECGGVQKIILPKMKDKNND